MISSDSLEAFPWPRPSDTDPSPIWTERGFRIGARDSRVLAFDSEQSHWSSELTELHEEEAGTEHAIDNASRKAAVHSLRRFMKAPSPIILDVGCSSGYVLQESRQALTRAALIGSDYILGPLIHLAGRMPNLPILQFDLRRCPLPNDCVDAVTALNVPEHVDRDVRALRQIHRILRPGGVAHIEVPAGPHLDDIYDKHLMHYRRYRLTELKAMSLRVGFDVLQATHLGFFVYPAFSFIKKRHQRNARAGQLSNEAQQVKTHIRESRSSLLSRMLTGVESWLSFWTSFPIGIRCVLVLRKP